MKTHGNNTLAFRRLGTLAMFAVLGLSGFGCYTTQGAEKDMRAASLAVEKATVVVHDEIHFKNPDVLKDAHIMPRLHTISASAEPGGSIKPGGKTSVPEGSSQSFIATADAGYQVADIVVDKHSVGAVPYLFQDNSSSYTFDNVAASHKISSSFKLTESR